MSDALHTRRVLDVEDALERLRDMLSRAGSVWFLDSDSPCRVSLKRARRVELAARTRYQQLEVAELEGYGLCMILDGKVQLAASDEHIYHEMLVHPACVLQGNPASALILGGGDGCAARELLRYPGIREIVVVDIDEEVVGFFREQFQELNRGSLKDPRVRVVPRDAMEFLGESQGCYDIIISDLTEPFDLAESAGDLSAHLYSAQAYSLILERLSPEGVFVCQSGGILYQPHYDKYHLEILRGIQGVFPHVASAYEFIPSFEAMWSITLGSRKPLVVSPLDVESTLARLGVKGLLHYDCAAHQRAFSPLKPAGTRPVG